MLKNQFESPAAYNSRPNKLKIAKRSRFNFELVVASSLVGFFAIMSPYVTWLNAHVSVR